MFKYLRLRASQQVLCLSFSVPVALFLTTAFSPYGTWSVSWFINYFAALMALVWGGLALYARETDRARKLTDSPTVVIRDGKNGVVDRIKAHERAGLIWGVLQDDDVIRRQLRAWWRGTGRILALSVRHLPSVFLMTACLAFWLVPEAGVRLIGQLRECPPECIVRWAAGGLTSMYILTGVGRVVCDVVINRVPASCFREAFLPRVAAYQQQDDDTSSSGVDAPA